MVAQGKTLINRKESTFFSSMCFPLLVLFLGLIIILLKTSAQDYWSRDSYKYIAFFQYKEIGDISRSQFDDYLFSEYNALPPALLFTLKYARVCGLPIDWTVVVLNIILWFCTGGLLYKITLELFSSRIAADTAVVLFVSLPSIYLVTTEVQRDIGYLFSFALLLNALCMITRKNGNWIWWFCAGASISMGIGWRREGLELLIVSAAWFATELICKKWHPGFNAIVRGTPSFLAGLVILLVFWGISVGNFSFILQKDHFLILWNRACYLFSN